VRHAARVALLVATACCGHAQHPDGRTGPCLSRERLLAAHLEEPMTQDPHAKLVSRRLLRVYDDVVAAHRAATTGAPAPALTSGACLPELLHLRLLFTGDEQPIDALAIGGFDATPPQHAGLRDGAGTFPTPALVQLVAMANVQTILEADTGQTQLNYSASDIQVDALRQQFPWMTGVGVTVVVIDTGIEWRHGAFKDSNGRTRIHTLWDLGLNPPRAGETAGPGGLGVVYSRAQINDAIDGHFSIRIGQSGLGDPDHGSNVAGTAAGDGSPRSCSCANCCRGSGVFVGVAPQADIIAIRVRNVLDVRTALARLPTLLPNQPAVVNVSIATHFGAHDGSDGAEQAIDTFTASAPGRMVVVGAGNDGCRNLHAEAVAPAAAGGHPGTVDVSLRQHKEGATDERRLVFFHAAATPLSVQIVAPGGAATAMVATRSIQHVNVGGVAVDIVGIPSPNGEIQLSITIHGPGENAEWIVRFQNAGAAAVTVHGWVTTFGNKDDCWAPFTFLPPHVSPATTITIPATARTAIVVGSYDNKTSWCDWTWSGGISSFSGRGPVRGAHGNNPIDPRPTITAPGRGITTPNYDACNLPGKFCSWWPDWMTSLYSSVRGTSISAPHVAGAIAIMLQVHPTMTRDDAVRILGATARPPVSTPDLNVSGFGKIDVNAAVAQANLEHLGPPHPIVVPRMIGGAPPPPPAIPQPPFAALTRTLRSGPDGELVAGLVSRHFSEARRLVNTSTKVAAMWHRAAGPAMLAELSRRSEGARAPAPVISGGQREYFEKFLEQLHRAGSPRLKDAIDRYGNLVIANLAS
jgi:subtilisin family serine protease